MDYFKLTKSLFLVYSFFIHPYKVDSSWVLIVTPDAPLQSAIERELFYKSLPVKSLFSIPGVEAAFGAVYLSLIFSICVHYSY